MKALKIIGVLISIFVVLLLIAVAYLKLFLPNVGTAPVVKIEATPERLERGKYLAENVTVCVDCHSTRDFTKYAGPIKAGPFGGGGEEFGHDFGFPGFFYSRNITPSHLSSWTDGEIVRAVTSGVSKDGTALFPLMNYLSFGN
ncbi:MAG: cytochrome C, partial [Flavitalea sp.]